MQFYNIKNENEEYLRDRVSALERYSNELKTTLAKINSYVVLGLNQHDTRLKDAFLKQAKEELRNVAIH